MNNTTHLCWVVNDIHDILHVVFWRRWYKNASVFYSLIHGENIFLKGYGFKREAHTHTQTQKRISGKQRIRISVNWSVKHVYNHFFQNFYKNYIYSFSACLYENFTSKVSLNRAIYFVNSHVGFKHRNARFRSLK